MEIDWCPSEKNLCRVNRQWTTAELTRKLGDLNWRVWQEADQLIFAYRGRSPQLFLGGMILTSLTPVDGGDIWAATVRVRNIDSAVIRYWLYTNSPRAQDYVPGTDGVWRGKYAPPAPPSAEPLRGAVKEIDIYCDKLNESRRVSYYLPPAYIDSRRYPVVYLTDGDQFLEFGFPQVVEPLIEKAVIPPLILVAVHAAPFQLHHDRRAEEYLPGIKDAAYAAHERFFTETARAWAEDELNAADDPKQRALMGYSRGAVFAGNTGIRKREIYGNVMMFSPADELRPIQASETSPRYYLLAGTLEEHFLRAAERCRRALIAANVEVAFKTRVAGHASTLWVEELPRALQWMFAGD